MSSLVSWVAGLIAVLASSYRLGRARRHLTPGVVYLSGAVGSVGLAAAVIAPDTLKVTAPIEPFPNATRLVGNGLAMLSAWCTHGLLSHSVLDPAQVRAAIRRQAVILVVAVATMTALLATAPVASNPDFVAKNTTVPSVLGYLLIFCAYIAVSLGNFIRLIQRYVRLTERPWLRRGLVITQTGSGIGIAWAVSKSSFAVIVFTTGLRLTIETPISAGLSAACVTLVAIGSTMPTWAPALAKHVRWVQHHHTYGVLTPLARALHDTLPELAHRLDTAAVSRDIEWRLARRLVEIRDGLLLLAPYRASVGLDEPELPADYARHSDPEAAAEAIAVAAALRARQAGAPAAVAVPAPPEHQADGLEDETAWLRRVARAYRRIPIVTEYESAPAGEERSEQR